MSEKSKQNPGSNSDRLRKVLASDALNPKFRSHLRLADITDAEFICTLRSTPELNTYISATSSDVQAQREWLSKYKGREAAGQEFYFVIQSDGNDVGVVRLYDFREINKQQSFSWGSWIIRPPRVSGLVTFSAVMVYEIGFDTLGFDRAHFEVIKGNDNVISFHLRSGAVLENTLSDRLEFGFWPEHWHTFKSESRDQIAKHRLAWGNAEA